MGGAGETLARRRTVKEHLVETGIDGFNEEEGDMPPTLTSNTDTYTTVYSMIDGAPRPINNLHLARVMDKRLPDGRPAFWMEGMPGSPPEYKLGDLKCFMHPEFEENDGPWGIDRAFIESVGLVGRTCNMSDTSRNNRGDFQSVFQRTAHERSKHPMEYETVREALERRESQLNRDLDERRIEAMMALAGAKNEPEEKPKRGPGRPRKTEE